MRAFATSQKNLTRQMLAETPPRALALLSAIGTDPTIRTVFATHGYTSEDHEEGWRLLGNASGRHTLIKAVAVAPRGNPEAAHAIAALKTWREASVRRLRAALDRLHPKESAFVFDVPRVLKDDTLGQVELLLNSLDALESSPQRKKTRVADHAALATLAKRGLTASERARLRALVEAALTLPKRPAAPKEDPDAARADLIALRRWYVDWAETARAILTSRHALIRAGLAKRKPRKARERVSDDAV